jgi:hypothetical protein
MNKKQVLTGSVHIDTVRNEEATGKNRGELSIERTAGFFLKTEQ